MHTLAIIQGQKFVETTVRLACVQTSPISFHPRKRDVCETASLIVFQYPAVFQEFVESAFIGCLTIATVRNNSDWLSSGNARDNVCDLHLAGFSIDKNMSDCVLCFSTILKNNDRNLVKSRSEFKVQEEILSLQFIVHETSPYICRSCVGKLRKRIGLYANVRKSRTNFLAIIVPKLSRQDLQ